MGRTVDIQKQRIRDKVPGKSLKDKMTHLYLENPERKAEEYMMKLSLTRDQVYGLKHIVKKALEEKKDTQGQSEQAATRLEPQYMQTSISENELPGIDPVSSPTPQHSFSSMEDLLPFDLGTSTNEPAQQKHVEQTPPVYQQPVYQQPVYQQQPIQEPIEPAYSQNVQENTYQQNHVQQPVQVAVQQPIHQQQSMYQQQPVQYQAYQQPIEQAYQQQLIHQQKPMYQPTMYQPIAVQQKPTQQLISPAPALDFNLADVDGGTIKSFLAITSDKVKNGAKYTLELKLVEC